MPSPESPKQIELLETVRKKRAALEARLRKESYRSIADRLDVTVGTVRVWVREMTQTMLPQDEVEELRAQEAAGYDESEARTLYLIELTAKEAQQRSDESLSTQTQVEMIAKLNDQLTSIRKQRAMLLGLNVPVQVKHNITVRTEFDAEVEALVSDLLGGGNVMTAPDMIDVGEE